jgi:hypothetical protein
MIETAIDQTAGGLAVAFFLWAWWTNRRSDSRAAGISAVILAIVGSMLFYAAPWSLWFANLVASILQMFGDFPVHPVMTIACLALLGGVVFDLINDPTYNVGAVWALIFAPIMARGAAGLAGSFLEQLFGGASMAFLDAVKHLFGA